MPSSITIRWSIWKKNHTKMIELMLNVKISGSGNSFPTEAKNLDISGSELGNSGPDFRKLLTWMNNYVIYYLNFMEYKWDLWVYTRILLDAAQHGSGGQCVYYICHVLFYFCLYLINGEQEHHFIVGSKNQHGEVHGTRPYYLRSHFYLSFFGLGCLQDGTKQKKKK